MNNKRHKKSKWDIIFAIDKKGGKGWAELTYAWIVRQEKKLHIDKQC